MDRLLVAAVATTVVSVLAAVLGVAWLICGQPGTGDGDSAELAVGTEEEFCDVFLSPFPLLEETFGDNQREYARLMLAAGLPADVAPEVRAGLLVLAEQAEHLPDDVLDGDLSEVPDLSGREDAAYTAFDDWARETCGAPY